MLSFPHSSSTAKQIFSQLNLIKDKKRNALKTETVNAIMAAKELIEDKSTFNWKKVVCYILKCIFYFNIRINIITLCAINGYYEVKRNTLKKVCFSLKIRDLDRDYVRLRDMRIVMHEDNMCRIKQIQSYFLFLLIISIL